MLVLSLEQTSTSRQVDHLFILIITSFIAVICIAIYGLATDPLPYSLGKVFWIFTLFFMGLAPLWQFCGRVHPFPWMHNQGILSSFLQANTSVLLTQIIFLLVRKRVMQPSDTPGVQVIIPLPVAQRFRSKGMLICMAAALLLMLLTGSLWHRALADSGSLIRNSSLQLLADKGLRGFVLYGCLLAISLRHQKQISRLSLVLLLGLAIASNFPTAIPRYWLAAFYLGLLLSCCPVWFQKKRRRFDALLSGGLVVLFPLFNLFRWDTKVIQYYTALPGGLFNRISAVYKDCFCGQDFDAYASLRNTILYVQQHGIAWGGQLHTTLLFFVPRKLWPQKSIGTGAIVNDPRPGSDFRNYCAPLWAEGYMDFGLFGSIIFLAGFAWLCTGYDRYYWKSGGPGVLLRLLYPAALGMFFFLLRGDLLSSFAYITGTLVAAAALHLLVFAKQSHQTII